MKTKNKTAGACYSSDGYINKKLSAVKINTPFEIEQPGFFTFDDDLR